MYFLRWIKDYSNMKKPATKSPLNLYGIVMHIQSMLVGSSDKKPVHWSTFTQQLVETGRCTNDELVSAMNTVIKPFGPVMGINHNFFVHP